MDGSIITQVLVLFLEVDPSKILDPIVGGEPTRVKSIQLKQSQADFFSAQKDVWKGGPGTPLQSLSQTKIALTICEKE